MHFLYAKSVPDRNLFIKIQLFIRKSLSMSKIRLTENEIRDAIKEAVENISEAYGIQWHGQFLKANGWGPTFTSNPDDAIAFNTPEEAEEYKAANEIDFGDVTHIPSADNEELLRETIRKVVRESLNEIDMSQFMNPSIGFDVQEKHKEGRAKPETQYTHHAGKGKKASKRAIVINWLKKNSVNDAAIMRMLWHPSPDEEDSMRSEFYKKRDGAINKDSGARYSFSDEEINQLYSIKSSGN